MIALVVLLGLVPMYGAVDGGPSVLLSSADSLSPYSSIVRYVGRVQCTGVIVATAAGDGDAGDARIDISESDGGWRISCGSLDPEISLYTYKSGRPGETRCDDPAGYRPALIPFIFLSRESRPHLFCAIPYDSGKNLGPAFEALLPSARLR